MATDRSGRSSSGGSDQERVPLAAGENRVLPPDGVHRDALVEPEEAVSVGALDDLDELVERVLLVQQPGLGLHRPGRESDERGQRRSHDEHTPPEEERGGEREQRSRAEQRPLRSHERDRDQRRDERADERAGGGERIEAPRDGAGGCDVGDRQADRERRDHPERDDGRGEEEEHGEERADHCARRSVVEIADRRVEKRPGEERRQRNPDRRRENDQAEQAWLRPPVGEPPSEPVAEGEPGEHDPDQVRPDDRRRAEVGREQP